MRAGRKERAPRHSHPAQPAPRPPRKSDVLAGPTHTPALCAAAGKSIGAADPPLVAEELMTDSSAAALDSRVPPYLISSLLSPELLYGYYQRPRAARGHDYSGKTVICALT